VFNTGDGLAPMSVQTDSAGRFRLGGFYNGPAYVFAQKEGLRFTAQRTQSGVKDVVVTMLRGKEIPPVSAQPEPRSWEEEKRLARDLLERLRAEGSGRRTATAVSAMARIDTEQAQKWSAALGGQYGAVLRRQLAKTIAEKEPDEALGLLAPEGPWGQEYYLEIARRRSRQRIPAGVGG
jgi:hypothetical protein